MTTAQAAGYAAPALGDAGSQAADDLCRRSHATVREHRVDMAVRDVELLERGRAHAVDEHGHAVSSGDLEVRDEGGDEALGELV